MPACCSRYAVEQSRHPGADHDDPEVAVGIDIVLPPLRAPPVVAAERELLLEQRDVVVHVGAADRVLHDAQQLVVATAGARDGNRRRGTRTSTLERERRAPSACCAALMPPCGRASRLRVGAQVVAQQRQVAGDVRQRGQQRRHLRLGEVGAELVVGGGDRVHRPVLITCR